MKNISYLYLKYFVPRFSTRSIFAASGMAVMVLSTAPCQAKPAASPSSLDRDSIKAFAGCYHVTYNFVETFALQNGYVLQPPYRTDSLEYATVDQESTDTIHLQHILIPDGVNAMKHWRQEWTYQGDEVFNFQGDGLWRKRHLTAAETTGHWTQRVLNVDDSPQYECSAPWVHWGDQHYWECEAWSPLPRREYSHRKDYNVLDRRNRQQVTATGWMHEQDNIKTLVSAASITPLVKERGENIYTRVDAKLCAPAVQFWAAHQAVWHSIQHAWRAYYASTEKVQLVKTGTPLYEQLNDLADDAETQKMTPAEIEKETLQIIKAATAP